MRCVVYGYDLATCRSVHTMDGTRTPRDMSIAAALLSICVGIIVLISFGIKGAAGSDNSSSTDALNKATAEYPDVITLQPTRKPTPSDVLTQPPTLSFDYYYGKKNTTKKQDDNVYCPISLNLMLNLPKI